MFQLLLGLYLLAVPQPLAGGGCIHDFADVLSNQSEQEIQQLCNQLESETSAELAVVTVSSLEGESVEDYAYSLFNTWGIGQKDTNNGVLLLIAPQEHRTRIEVGYGLEPLLTDAYCGAIINDSMIPYFKQNDFDNGAIQGAQAISSKLLSDPAAAHGFTSSLPKWLSTPQRQVALVAPITLGASIFAFIVAIIIRRKKNFPHYIFWPSMLVLLGLGAWLVSLFFKGVHIPGTSIPATITAFISSLTNLFAFRRYRPRKCPNCGTLLSLMPEDLDDTKLEAGMQLEEKLGSVDYDVWSCPACLTIKREKYTGATKYKVCDQCKYRTFEQTSRTVTVPATTYNSGSAHLHGVCRNCKFEKDWTEIIPKISTSSGSSSSSGGGGGGGGGFSGGSSGGGGASGGW